MEVVRARGREFVHEILTDGNNYVREHTAQTTHVAAKLISKQFAMDCWVAVFGLSEKTGRHKMTVPVTCMKPRYNVGAAEQHSGPVDAAVSVMTTKVT